MTGVVEQLPLPQPPPAAPMAVSDPTAMMPQLLGSAAAAGNLMQQPQPPPPPPPPVVVTLSGGAHAQTMQPPPPPAPGQLNGGIPGIAPPPPPVLLDQHHHQAVPMAPPPPPPNGQVQMNGSAVAHLPQMNNGQQQHPIITSVPAPLPTTTMNGALHQMNGGLQLQMQPQQQQGSLQQQQVQTYFIWFFIQLLMRYLICHKSNYPSGYARRDGGDCGGDHDAHGGGRSEPAKLDLTSEK